MKLRKRRILHFGDNVVVSTPREDLLYNSAYWSERNPFPLLVFYELLYYVVVGITGVEGRKTLGEEIQKESTKDA